MVDHFPLKRAKKKLHFVCAPVLVFSVGLTCGSLGITTCTQDYSLPSALRATCCFSRCISNMIWQHKTKHWNGIIGFPAGGIWNRIQSLLLGILCLVHAGVTVCAYSIPLRKSAIGKKVPFKGIYVLFCCVNHQTQLVSQAQCITNVLAIICTYCFLFVTCNTLFPQIAATWHFHFISVTTQVCCLPRCLCHVCKSSADFPVLTCSHFLYPVTSNDTNPLWNWAYPKKGCFLLSFFYCAHRFFKSFSASKAGLCFFLSSFIASVLPDSIAVDVSKQNSCCKDLNSRWAASARGARDWSDYRLDLK